MSVVSIPPTGLTCVGRKRILFSPFVTLGGMHGCFGWIDDKNLLLEYPSTTEHSFSGDSGPLTLGSQEFNLPFSFIVFQYAARFLRK